MEKASKYNILIADDESAITSGLSELLKEEGYNTDTTDDGNKAFDKLQKYAFNLVLVDLMIPGMDGLQILNEIKKRQMATEVIIITGKGTISTAVKAIKAGAYDYLTKPVEPERLKTIIPKALEYQDLVLTNKRLQQTIRNLNLTRYEDLIGTHEKMRQVYQLIETVAGTAASVFITGESGTGKELVARAIHQKSGRADHPFIAINCSAFPRDILENELFGHEKGAFTGALNEKAGCFEMADAGTLFLDEIGELAVDTQSKLLRVLEEKRFRRLGGTKEISVDVRVIAATNRNIEKALEQGQLREDLYYRLKVVEIELPPLRERMSDLEPLIAEFLRKSNQQNNKNLKGFSPECLKVLRNYDWPGNVRELRNVIERAVILCPGETIQTEYLPSEVFQPKGKASTQTMTVHLGQKLDEIEREIILKTLQLSKNNKTKAAKRLGISLKTMHNKLNKYFEEEEATENSDL